MRGVLTAEFSKILRHRATWGLVWIFPLGLIAIFLLGLALRHVRPIHAGLPPTPEMWIANTTVMWKVAASGPGRLFIGAFTALVFAGEYGWNTWKLIVPHRRRLELMAAKYVVVIALLMISFVIAAVLGYGVDIVGPMMSGEAGPPAGITVGALLDAHARAALTTLIATLLTVGYASLASILLRSTLGGAIVAVAAVTVEGLAATFAPLIEPTIYLALPSYHLRNLSSWITKGSAAIQPLPSGLIHDPWMVSLAWIAGWIVVLWASAIVLFERQDLN